VAAHTTRRRWRSRRVVVVGLGIAVLAGVAALWVGPALADPTPMPGPPPTRPVGPSASPPWTPPGVPDPGAAPPGGPTRPSSPSPSAPARPSLAPTPGPPTPSTSDDPAFWDIKGQIRVAVVELIGWAAEQAIEPVMQALGESWLSTPDFTSSDAARGMWTASLVVANAVFVLFIVMGGFVISARETLQTRYGLKEIVPRLAMGGVAANCSLLLLPKLIAWTNALTVAIAANTIDGPTAAKAIRKVVDQALQNHGFLMVLLVIAVIVMCLVVEFTFVVRLAALIMLFGLAPLALICHASPYTEGIAYTWWRALGACLGLQVAQAVVVMATIKIFLTPAGSTLMGVPSTSSGLFGVLICLTMLWVLVKLPGWMRQFILGPLGQNRRGLIGTLVHAYLMIKTLGAAAGIGQGAKTAARTAGAAGGRSGRTPRPPSPPRPRGGPRPRGPRPSPAGPAAFSHAPTTHAPLPSPAGTNGAPAFSNPPTASTPAPSPVPGGSVPAAQFSHPPSAQPNPPSPPPAAGPVSFSGPPTPAASGRATSGTAAPAVTFSAAPTQHSAPRRPPAPVTPVFSSAPAQGTAASGAAANTATRPTAARRGSTTNRTPTGSGSGSARTASPGRPASTPPAPVRQPSSPTHAPRTSGSPPAAPSPVVRPARPTPSPPARPAPNPPPVVRAARPTPPAPSRSGASPPTVRSARPAPSPPRPRNGGDRS
jgi:hypothetical protein